jgi:hypoxanthine phosphoribosyltransferase
MNANNVKQIHDLKFEKFLDAQQIEKRIQEMGQQITDRFRNRKIVSIGILNGAFIFMADLLRHCDLEIECRFLRVKSYAGTSSTGKLTIENPEQLEVYNMDVLIIEDIVDSGLTMNQLLKLLKEHKPASITIASFLHKPSATVYPVELDFVGFAIPDDFVVGYGLDYDGMGRNLPDLYKIVKS